MEIEKSGWKCWVALPNRIFVSSPVVYLQNDGTNGIFVLCSVLCFYQVRGPILLRMVWCGEFFFLKRNVNYVLIKPCPFLTPSQAPATKEQEQQKAWAHLNFCVCLRAPDALESQTVQHRDISPSHLDRKAWESADSRILPRVLTTSLAILKKLVCLTLTFYVKYLEHFWYLK